MSLSTVDQNLVSILIIGLIVLVIYILDRKNFSKEGLFLLRRTKRGVSFVDEQARKHRRFYTAFGILGILTSLGWFGLREILEAEKRKKIKFLYYLIFALFSGMVLVKFPSLLYAGALVLGGVVLAGTAFLFKNALLLLMPSLREQAVASLQLVLPLKVENAPVFYVPLPYWLIAILVILVVHEFAHALVARARGVPVKSVGYGFLGIIPIGFAEPDESALKRKSLKTRLMVYAAGSFSNFMFGFFFLILFQITLVLASFVLLPAGVSYEGKFNDTYAFNIIPDKGVITSINNISIRSLSDLQTFLENADVNQTIEIVINNETYEIKLSPNPKNTSKPFIGITNVKNKLDVKPNIKNMVGEEIPYSLLYFATLLHWLFMLNIGIGIANLLPLRPMDGGFMTREIILHSRIFARRKSTAVILTRSIETLVIMLFLMNIFGPYLLK